MTISSDRINFALRDAKVEVMNFLNEVALRYPNAISFAPGRPLEDLFDVKASLEFIDDYVTYDSNHRTGNRHGYAALGQYGRTNGVIGELIAELLRQDEKLSVCHEDIIVTVGAQEAMCICLLGLCGNPGDVVLVVDPAYIGISGAARILGIEVVAVPADDDGVDLDVLERVAGELTAVGKHPRVLYLSPDFANPTGITTSTERREKLLDVTRRLNLLVLEDHAYNYFHYDESPLRSLKSMQGSEHVIYLGSFSKSIYPGLRLGFIAADQRIITNQENCIRLSDEFSKIKSLLTVNTSPICQAIVGGLLVRNKCSLRSFVEPRRQVLQKNRDAMLDALARNFPKEQEWCHGIQWNTPTGGFFLTLKVPFAVTDRDLISSAERYGVIWTPMSYFFLQKEASEEIRLSFSYVTPEQIFIGIAALAQSVKQRILENKTLKAHLETNGDSSSNGPEINVLLT